MKTAGYKLIPMPTDPMSLFFVRITLAMNRGARDPSAPSVPSQVRRPVRVRIVSHSQWLSGGCPEENPEDFAFRDARLPNRQSFIEPHSAVFAVQVGVGDSTVSKALGQSLFLHHEAFQFSET